MGGGGQTLSFSMHRTRALILGPHSPSAKPTMADAHMNLQRPPTSRPPDREAPPNRHMFWGCEKRKEGPGACLSSEWGQPRLGRVHHCQPRTADCPVGKPPSVIEDPVEGRARGFRCLGLKMKACIPMRSPHATAPASDGVWLGGGGVPLLQHPHTPHPYCYKLARYPSPKQIPWSPVGVTILSNCGFPTTALCKGRDMSRFSTPHPHHHQPKAPTPSLSPAPKTPPVNGTRSRGHPPPPTPRPTALDAPSPSNKSLPLPSSGRRVFHGQMVRTATTPLSHFKTAQESGLGRELLPPQGSGPDSTPTASRTPTSAPNHISNRQ